jgi:hypothetical protein
LVRYRQLEALWLNDNNLTALHGFDCNATLQAIYAHNNGIYTLAGSLQNLRYLRSLSLYGNKLRDLKATLPYIRHLQYLVALDLFDNPLANEPNYRSPPKPQQRSRKAALNPLQAARRVDLPLAARPRPPRGDAGGAAGGAEEIWKSFSRLSCFWQTHHQMGEPPPHPPGCAQRHCL